MRLAFGRLALLDWMGVVVRGFNHERIVGSDLRFWAECHPRFGILSSEISLAHFCNNATDTFASSDGFVIYMCVRCSQTSRWASNTRARCTCSTSVWRDSTPTQQERCDLLDRRPASEAPFATLPSTHTRTK